MGRQVAVVLYVVAMAAVIVGVDFAFFRNLFWERLAVNIGVVWVFGAFYLFAQQRKKPMPNYFEQLKAERSVIEQLAQGSGANGFFAQEVLRFYSIAGTLLAV